MPTASPLKRPTPPPPGDEKKQKKKWLSLAALITSTPFLIAIAVHVLALVGVGSVVIFKGGNPLAMFSGEKVDSGDAGAEAPAPPSNEEPSPQEDSAPMAETTPTPTEITETTDLLSLSTPSPTPSFAPTTPAKTISAPSMSAGTGSSPSPKPTGKTGGRRSAKSTLFGFTEKVGGELEGTMYDLKLKTDGKKPSGIDDKTFPEAVRKIVRTRFRPNSLNEFYKVDKKFFATQFFIPLQVAGKAPETFGVKGKVKPNNFIIHYSGSFAAPEDGLYRFVGLGDDSILVMVDGSVKFEGNWVPFTSYGERNDKPGVEVLEFFPTIDANKSWARLREGDWINLKKNQPHQLDIALVEQGDPKAEGGGNFAFVLLIEKQGSKYELSKKSKTPRPILPLFMLEPPDSNMEKVIRENLDKLEVSYKDGPFFGTTAPAPEENTPTETSPNPKSSVPENNSSKSDQASGSVYETGWKEGTTGGTGFGNWILKSNGNPDQKSYAGFYLAKEQEKPGIAPLATDGKAWGIFADGEGFQEACAFRPFSSPLTSGQTFSIELMTPNPKSNSGSTGSIGLTLRTGNTSEKPTDYNQGARFEFTALEGKPNYQIFDGSDASDSGLPIPIGGVRLEMTLTSNDLYDLKIIPLGGGSPLELKGRKLGGTAGAPIDSLAIFNRDSEANAFFNKLTVRP